MYQDTLLGFRPERRSLPEQADGRVDLRDLLRILRRRRRWIVATTLLFVGAALAYGLLARPLYTATAQILVDPRERRVVLSEVNPTALPADGGLAQVESQLKVVGSDNVLARVAAREGLAEDPEFGGERTGWIARTLRAVGFSGARETPERKAVRLLRKGLALKRSDKAFVIDVAVTSEDSEKSARLANAVVRAYLDDIADARADANRRASAALGARLDDLRKRVEDAENRVEAYKAANNIVGASGRLVNEQQLTELNNQLVAARSRAAEAKARFEQIQKLQRSPTDAAATAEAAASPAIIALRTQIAEITRQEADLKTQYGPRHPAVATVEAQLRDARRLVSAELARIAGSARNDYERAQANAASLEASLGGMKADALSTGRAFVRLRELEREVEAERAVYGAFLTRARETGEQESIDTSNARVITHATPPESKSWPPRALLLAASLIAGLGLGTGMALSREHLDTTATSGTRLAERIGLPLLSVVPRPTLARAVPLLPAPGAAARPDPLKRSSTVALRRLRHLLRGRTDRISQQVFAVAGSGPEETWLVALGLAEAAVAEGETVMLVDADPRGTLSQTLGPARCLRLGELTAGSTPLYDGGLRGPTANPLLLVGGVHEVADPERDLGRLVREAAKLFDLVLIDCGGDCRGEAAHAAAALADDVLVVGEAGVTREDRAQEATTALRETGAHLRGLVFIDGQGRRA